MTNSEKEVVRIITSLACDPNQTWNYESNSVVATVGTKYLGYYIQIEADARMDNDELRLSKLGNTTSFEVDRNKSPFDSVIKYHFRDEPDEAIVEKFIAEHEIHVTR